MDYALWVEKAIRKTAVLEKGMQFELRDLFPHAEWEGQPVSDRRKLGKWFKETVKSGKVPTVVIEETKKGKSCAYEKAE